MKKQENRSKILKYLFRNSPIARATIAEETEITPATVTANVTALIKEGIVTDLGAPDLEQEVMPGRKRILIDINPNHSYSIGIEFTIKNITLCLTNLRGDIVDQMIYHTETVYFESITQFLIHNIETLIARNSKLQSKLIGIGIAIPGHMNDDQEHMIANSNTFFDFNLSTIQKACFLPIVCENNIMAMAYGEYFFHAENCPENFALFHVGRGMFCASMRDGELFHGTNYFSGEIGHTIVNAEGRKCECGKYGCLQTHSSEEFLIKSAKYLYQENPKTILRSLVSNENEITIHHIMMAYSLGDPMVSACISEAIKYLGITTSNIAIILNPEKILLHGELFTNKAICHELMDYTRRQLMFVDKLYGNTVNILPYSPLEGAIGASALAISSFFINNIQED